MTTYIVIEFSEESGPGSSPSVAVHAFASPEGRAGFVADWGKDKAECGYEQTQYGWHSRGWVYWLDERETELLP